MGKTLSVLCAIALAAAPACDAAENSASAARIELSMEAGPDWSHVKWFGPVRLVLAPQIAVWLEDADGRYVADVFVTEKAGKSGWGAARRPEALPVWSHARGRRYPDGLFMPTKDEPLPDAVCGATPKAKKTGTPMVLKGALPQGLEAGSYRLMAEVNCSFDFNGAYPETKGDVNGQPSVVYSGPLDLRVSSYSELTIVGTGNPSGADGTIAPGSEGLDSALRIVRNLRARVLR